VIDIPAGTLHAIGKGIILIEIQQNSDATYRVYDYGRVGRQLHLEKALQVINFASEGRTEKCSGIKLTLGPGCSKRIVTANRYFCTEIYDLDGKISENADGSKFAIYVFTSGSGTISWWYNGQRSEIPAGAGESVLIPAAMGDYILSGSFTAIKTYLPDFEADILKPLLSVGHSIDEIVSSIGGLKSALSFDDGRQQDLSA
jgi:mannose-6-phosphate isomerase